MDMEVFTVAGWQFGKFEIKDGKDAGLLKPYANIFVIQDMTGVMNDNYHFCGAKSIKKKVIDPSLLSKFQPGDKVHLYFDSNDRVAAIQPVK